MPPVRPAMRRPSASNQTASFDPASRNPPSARGEAERRDEGASGTGSVDNVSSDTGSSRARSAPAVVPVTRTGRPSWSTKKSGAETVARVEIRLPDASRCQSGPLVPPRTQTVPSGPTASLPVFTVAGSGRIPVARAFASNRTTRSDSSRNDVPPGPQAPSSAREKLHDR